MIKEVNETHIAECVGVIRESFRTVADALGFTPENAPGFTAFATDENRLRWHMHGEHRLMYAFFDEERIVGYFSLFLQDENECELSNLCVLPSYRHKGIGEALLQHAFETAKKQNCCKMNIGIVEENTVLRRWYEALGFVHLCTKKFDHFPFTCGFMEKKL